MKNLFWLFCLIIIQIKSASYLDQILLSNYLTQRLQSGQQLNIESDLLGINFLEQVKLQEEIIAALKAQDQVMYLELLKILKEQLFATDLSWLNLVIVEYWLAFISKYAIKTILDLDYELKKNILYQDLNALIKKATSDIDLIAQIKLKRDLETRSQVDELDNTSSSTIYQNVNSNFSHKKNKPIDKGWHDFFKYQKYLR